MTKNELIDRYKAEIIAYNFRELTPTRNAEKETFKHCIRLAEQLNEPKKCEVVYSVLDSDYPDYVGGTCSECGIAHRKHRETIYNLCPNCGARITNVAKRK